MGTEPKEKCRKTGGADQVSGVDSWGGAAVNGALGGGGRGEIDSVRGLKECSRTRRGER